MAGWHIKALARTAGATLLLTAAAVAEAQEVEETRFSAQRRPRVAVLEFDNANAEAARTRYASSVEAMLVTFLQRKSQVAVVERNELGGLYEEKRRIQRGQVDVPPGDTAALKLLERVDAYILGSVTLLDGPRIEIDVKLFSRFDGRVVAAAQRSGPPDCLRPIVERLGVALEREYLRPYLGHLEVRLTAPENVGISLTPIPPDTAPDEERAPRERSSTVKIGGGYDTVEPWITNPTSYTIKDLLPGWYSLRLARAGYEDLKTDNRRWEVRRRSGRLEVVDRTTGLSLDEVERELRRFVVRVDTGATTRIDGDALGFALRKKGGSLAPRVKRQHLDKDHSRRPGRAILMGGRGLDLNPFQRIKKVTDAKCDLVRDRPFPFPDHGLTHVAAGQAFDFESFQGGELIIEDYQGEIVPVGWYEMVLWDPHFKKSEKIEAIVRDRDHQKEVRADLDRETLPLKLEATGARPGHRVFLKGRETRYSFAPTLDFTGTKEHRGLPADTYKVSTNIPGLDGWTRTFEHLPGKPIAPRYYTPSSPYDPETTRTYEDEPARPDTLIVKTRFAVAGRLDLLHRIPNPGADDLFMDEEAGKLLDRVFKEPTNQHHDLLSRRLEVIDLLILGPQDMERLRQSPETAWIIQDYVKRGGAIFAFVLGAGDYGKVVGEPLVIESRSKPTARFDLTPGQVPGLIPRFDRKVDLPIKRALPEVARLPASWRVIAFTEVLETPRILESGEKDTGGYIALWLDDPTKFRDRQGKPVARVEETRANVEERVLKWARYLMYRRYDKSGKLRQRAEAGLGW